MIYVMPDTCVWYNLMEDADLRSPVRSLERLVNRGKIILLTTKEIQREFEDPDSRKVQHGRTEHDVIKAFAKRNMSSSNEDARTIANLIMKNTEIYNRTKDIAEVNTHAKDLLQRSTIIQGNQEVDTKVMNRIIARKAPFGRRSKIGRNFLNDTIIIEKFAKRAGEGGADDEFVFVTKNHEDFALAQDPGEPHADLNDIFTVHRHFTNSIVAVINTVGEMVSETGHLEGADILTRKSWEEIVSKVRQLEKQAAYHSHLSRKKDIEEGRCKLTMGWDSFVLMRHRKFGQRSWDQEMIKAAGTLADFSFLPSEADPFQEGMTKGALLALGWVLGSEPEPYPAHGFPTDSASGGADERLGTHSIEVPRSAVADGDRPIPRRGGVKALQQLTIDEDEKYLQGS